MSKQEIIRAGISNVLRSPRRSLRRLAGPPEALRGAEVAKAWPPPPSESSADDLNQDGSDNALRRYFNGIKDGPGVWKWRHYFEIYHQHLKGFIDRPVTIAEVGIYSGGSLPMWHNYFGDRCRVHGIDIQEDCRVYADSRTDIHIGDQSDRLFWQRFRSAVPDLDVLIDDGGHEPEQQMVTLEEMLPHLRPGGVYICEDVHQTGNHFATFVHALADHLNAMSLQAGRDLSTATTPFQAAIHSIHLYPFVVVIEKRANGLKRLDAPRHGSKWQPFL